MSVSLLTVLAMQSAAARQSLLERFRIPAAVVGFILLIILFAIRARQ